MALARAAGAQTLDFKAEDIDDRIQELMHGRGADAWHKNIQHTVRYNELSPERFLERLNSVTIRNFTDTLHVVPGTVLSRPATKLFGCASRMGGRRATKIS